MNLTAEEFKYFMNNPLPPPVEFDDLPSPPKEWLIEIENDSKLNSKKQADIIKDFWNNPTLLKTKEFNIQRGYVPDSTFTTPYADITKEQGLECLKRQKPEVYERLVHGMMKQPIFGQKEYNKLGIKVKTEISQPIRNKLDTKFYFKLNVSLVYPKGIEMKNIKHEDQHLHFQLMRFHKQDDSSKLLSIKLCFNIIQKQFKVLQVTKKDFYIRYFTWQPFLPYEECGIEVLYARKGYSIDGKRLPNFNRGSVYGLKQSVLENNFKMKDVKAIHGNTKKDDLIKFLMKL
jgi:hypothetical protein